MKFMNICPESKHKGTKFTKKTLRVLCVFVVDFIDCGAPVCMSILLEEAGTVLDGRMVVAPSRKDGRRHLLEQFQHQRFAVQRRYQRNVFPPFQLERFTGADDEIFALMRDMGSTTPSAHLPVGRRHAI
ncbi:MAG: hypothetical protein DYG89_24090 [Caldilinea sp. CFX5]|nr:hypothetical protein [Caldilinea sp. CFX5]